MLKTTLLAGAIAVLGATAALANPSPVADNFQPYMWQSPQELGRPMTATQLGMTDRVNEAPAVNRSAAYVARRPVVPAGAGSYSALYEGRAAFVPSFNYDVNKPVEWTGGNGGHSDIYGDNVPIRPFEAQEIRTSR
jgi:hypothetical protein